MVEYKMVYGFELLDAINAANKGRERIDSEDVSNEQKFQAFMARVNLEGKDGWYYAESCPAFNSYMFWRDADGASYQYKSITTDKLEKNGRTLKERLDNIMKAYAELSKDGWVYRKEIGVDGVFPRIEVVFVKKTTKAAIDKAAEEAAKIAAAKAAEKKTPQELAEEKQKGASTRQKPATKRKAEEDEIEADE